MARERGSDRTAYARLWGSWVSQVEYSLPLLPRGPLPLWQAAAAQLLTPWYCRPVPSSRHGAGPAAPRGGVAPPPPEAAIPTDRMNRTGRARRIVLPVAFRTVPTPLSGPHLSLHRLGGGRYPAGVARGRRPVPRATPRIDTGCPPTTNTVPK